MNHLVVDVEIARTVEQAGGWDRTDAMGVGVACVYSFRDDRFTLYGPGDVAALRGRLLEADRVSGFNHVGFDLPVIWGVPRYGGHGELAALRPRCDDLLERIWTALGDRRRGWKLGEVCQRTIGRTKIGDGADAPLLYQQGQLARLHTYVLDDVSLERDLTAWVDRVGSVAMPNGTPLYLGPWKGA